MRAAEGGTIRASLQAETTPALDSAPGPITATGSGLTVPDTGALLLEGLDTGVRLAPVTAPGPLTAPGPSTGDDTGVGPNAASALRPTLAGSAAAPRAGARPGVVQLAIREKAALYAAYMPFLDGGGLFVPTTRAVRLGDELYLILSLMDDPNKLSVTGKVVWITPSGTPQRQQGLGVQFAKDEAGTRARSRIEDLLGGTLKANRPTHTI
ncbi:MAG TPA: PilZ domain-containing protein [Zeimonas sp.]